MEESGPILLSVLMDWVVLERGQSLVHYSLGLILPETALEHRTRFLLLGQCKLIGRLSVTRALYIFVLRERELSVSVTCVYLYIQKYSFSLLDSFEIACLGILSRPVLPIPIRLEFHIGVDMRIYKCC